MVGPDAHYVCKYLILFDVLVMLTWCQACAGPSAELCGFPCLFPAGVSPSLKKSSPPSGPGISFSGRCFFTGSVSVIVTGLSWGLYVHVTISVGCVFKESSISSGGKLL